MVIRGPSCAFPTLWGLRILPLQLTNGEKKTGSHGEDTYAKKSTGNFSLPFILICFLCLCVCKCVCVCDHTWMPEVHVNSISTAFHTSFERSLTEPRDQQTGLNWLASELWVCASLTPTPELELPTFITMPGF